MLGHRAKERLNVKLLAELKKMPPKLYTQCVRPTEKAEDLVLKNHSQKWNKEWLRGLEGSYEVTEFTVWGKNSVGNFVHLINHRLKLALLLNSQISQLLPRICFVTFNILYL